MKQRTDTHVFTGLDSFKVVGIPSASSVDESFAAFRYRIEEITRNIAEARSSSRWEITH